MKPTLFNRIILFPLLCLVCTVQSAVAANTVDALPAPVFEALQAAHISPANVGLYVQDVDQDTPIVAHKASEAMSPASTMKLVTTYAALELLGTNYTWKTEAFADGKMEGDVLKGNLVIKGSGDPSLTEENFWKLLHDLRAKGLREITGDLVIDRQIFDVKNGDPGDFDGEPLKPYNVGPDALLVNFKTMSLKMIPDEGTGMVKVVQDPELAGISVFSHIKLVNGDCGEWKDGLEIQTTDTEKATTIIIRGKYPVECGERAYNVSILNHNRYVYALFRQLWQEMGGVIHGGVKTGETPMDAQLLGTLESRPLDTVVRDMNKYSNNVMARQLLLTLGAMCGTPGTPENGAATVKGWLKGRGMDFPELVIENGSGLSRTARISAEHMGQLLVSAYRSAVMPEFMASLPIAAVDGTMRKRALRQEVAAYAHIKTGSLEGVRAIAGYVRDQKGHTKVVVFFANDPNANQCNNTLDELLEWAYTY